MQEVTNRRLTKKGALQETVLLSKAEVEAKIRILGAQIEKLGEMLTQAQSEKAAYEKHVEEMRE